MYQENEKPINKISKQYLPETPRRIISVSQNPLIQNENGDNSGQIADTLLAQNAIAELAAHTASEPETPNIDINDPNLDDSVRMYLRSIGPTKLLSAPEEAALANRMKKDASYNDHLKELVEKQALLSAIRKEIKKTAKLTDIEPMKKEEKEAQNELIEARKELARTDGGQAFLELTQANLRLVVSIAKKYVGLGLSLMDLIQEGNIGLMRAAEKFEEKGFRFSTYARWWIKRGVISALIDQSRTIRIPKEMFEQINSMNRILRHLQQELGREPKDFEIAKEMGISREKVNETITFAQHPISLETPIENNDGTSGYLEDLIEDPNSSPKLTLNRLTQKEQVEQALEFLTAREKEILKLRFGITDGHKWTLEEIAKEYKITKERVRQIEEASLHKLNKPRLLEKIEGN